MSDFNSEELKYMLDNSNISNNGVWVMFMTFLEINNYPCMEVIYNYFDKKEENFKHHINNAIFKKLTWEYTYSNIYNIAEKSMEYLYRIISPKYVDLHKLYLSTSLKTMSELLSQFKYEFLLEIFRYNFETKYQCIYTDKIISMFGIIKKTSLMQKLFNDCPDKKKLPRTCALLFYMGYEIKMPLSKTVQTYIYYLLSKYYYYSDHEEIVYRRMQLLGYKLSESSDLYDIVHSKRHEYLKEKIHFMSHRVLEYIVPECIVNIINIYY